MAMLGNSLGKASRTDEALAVLGAEITAAAARGELQFAPELYRIKGELLAERSAELPPGSGERAVVIGDAQDSLDQALSMAAGQEAKMLQLRAATALAFSGKTLGEARMRGG
jgi:hypothetical protein